MNLNGGSEVRPLKSTIYINSFIYDTTSAKLLKQCTNIPNFS